MVLLIFFYLQLCFLFRILVFFCLQMFAYGGEMEDDQSHDSTDIDSSDSYENEGDLTDASEYDEDKATREKRRKEFDQLCRQNCFGEAPSISSDESSILSGEELEDNNKSRFVVSSNVEPTASDGRILSIHPGTETTEFIGKSDFAFVDRSVSLSLNQIPPTVNEVIHTRSTEKKFGSDPFLIKTEISPNSACAVANEEASDITSLRKLCQQQRQWLDELRGELFRSKEDWQRESRTLTHKLMLCEGEQRQMDEQCRSLRQRLSDEQMKVATLEKQYREEVRVSQRLEEEKLQSERDAIAAREEANSLQDQLISLTRTTGLYQERNAMAEKWASERSSLLNEIESLRSQAAERQSYVERAENTIRQLEDQYRNILSNNDQIVAEKRRVDLERDRLARALELATTEARLAVTGQIDAKTSTPRVPGEDFVTFDSSPLVNSTPCSTNDNVLKAELAKSLAANRENMDRIRSLEQQLSHLREISDSDHMEQTITRLEKERDDLKVKISEVIEENHRLSSKLRDFVVEADRDKQAAVESCRTACLRLHDDAKKSVASIHQSEIEELQKKHEDAINQMLVEMRGLNEQIDDAKNSYLQACSERAESEEKIRQQYEGEISELRSTLACETSAFQEKLAMKERQLESSRVNQQTSLKSVLHAVITTVDSTTKHFQDQANLISSKLSILYGRFDALGVLFNRLSFILLSSKHQSLAKQSGNDEIVAKTVVQLRALFLDTAQRMRETYLGHSKASEERNRQVILALSKQFQPQRRALAARQESPSYQN